MFHHCNRFKDKMIWWARYIDDIILWWRGTEQELLSFHDYRYLNAANPNVKLSLEYDKDKIHFLDLKNL